MYMHIHTSTHTYIYVHLDIYIVGYMLPKRGSPRAAPQTVSDDVDALRALLEAPDSGEGRATGQSQSVHLHDTSL